MANFSCRGRGAALMAVAAWLASAACSLPAEIDLPAAGAQERVLPPAQLEAVIFEGYSGDVQDLEVRASSATVDAGGRTGMLHDVVIALTEERRGRVEIRAPEGEFRMDTDDFSLHGEVIGRTREGERFTTRDLRFDHARRVLWTDAPVRLDRKNLVLRATGMELDVATRSIKLLGRVKAELGTPG